MSTKRRTSRRKVVESRKVPRSKEPVVFPGAVKPAAELNVNPDAELNVGSDVELNVGPSVEMKTGTDSLGTQIEGIDSKLKVIDDKITSVDLKGIEDKMIFTISAVGEMNKNVANIEKELHSLGTYAQIVICLGVGGIFTMIIYFLRLTNRI